jgi:hypothetical protein
MRLKNCLILGILIGVVLGVLGAFALRLVARRGPTTQALTQKYLDAVLQQDAEVAVALAETGCQRQVRQKAQKDIAHFGGAQIRNIAIQITHGTGSEETVEFGWATFDYRQSDQTEWQSGKIEVVTLVPRGWGSTRVLSCGG